MSSHPRAHVVERTIAELRAVIDAGEARVRDVTEACLERIADLDGGLRSVIETNPDALATADRLDARRRGGEATGPLYGIPVLVKDNLDTADRMGTTAGSLALADSIVAADATVVAKLRAAGAIILGKTNMSEWANIRSSRSTSGWSARGGQARNPFDRERSPSGSSSGSGIATAMSFAAACIGTETDGSIISPANVTGIVGVKPTVGLVSRAGVIPISHTQDTVGPMARSVADAAALLSVISGRDSRDPATSGSPVGIVDYRTALHRHGLVGARIGIARAGYAGFDDEVDQLFESAIADMRVAGAVIIDPADLPSAEEMHDKRDQENVVMLYEFKHDVAAYLATRKPGPGGQMPPRSLADLIAFNIDHHELELAYFGQDLFEQAESSWPEDEYRAALADNIRMARRDGIDAVIEEHRLDALVAPSGGPAWPTGLGVPDTWTGGASSAEAMAGYPVVTVPMGFVGLLPVGVSFFGTAWSEATLLRCAFAYEQATRHRRAPRVTA